MTRAAGLLLHPTSLPGRFGIGDAGPSAIRFLEWAKEAGQTLWQILPLGPTGFGNSPYCLLSAFAGNPLLISPERLVEDGLLLGSFLASAPHFEPGRVAFDSVFAWKKLMLRRAFDRFRSDAPASLRRAFGDFCGADEQAPWLEDWALYAGLKSTRGRREWTAWEPDLRDRRPGALQAARNELADEVEYRKFVQFLFFRQWGLLRDEARRREIALIGDIPIYVAPDSADVWANRDLFCLDASGYPEVVAGVPPDYFSELGQLWGNPLFRWDRMERDGFRWWIERVRTNLRTADLVRIDHFRGFAAYWAVPAGEQTAVKGKWMPGPGSRLFDTVRAALGPVPLIAEDLGDITGEVRDLLAATGFPGMTVLQFAFGTDDHEYQPHKFVPNAVVYTGTHDNDTTAGWWRSLGEGERTRVRDYLGVGDELGWGLLRAAYTSVADRVIVPVQDVFCLGSEARMNMPGRDGEHWTWRALEKDFDAPRAAGLRRLAELTGRCEALAKGA